MAARNQPAASPLFVFAHLGGNFVPAGRLELVEQGSQLLASSFAYGRRYLERANALEVDPVSLPLHERDAVRDRLLQPVNGLTFFGGIRDAAPDAWGRRVIESRLRAPANSLPESTYLLEAGSERTGALDIRRALDAPATAAALPVPLEYLLDAAARIEDGLPVPAHLAAIFDAGSSLGGMRPKANVRHPADGGGKDDVQAHLEIQPRDEHPSLWLAKFPSVSDRQLDVPLIEFATLRLAAHAGLRVPELRCVQAGGKNVLLVQRFDRRRDAGTAFEQRLHVVSALTLLACHEQESPTKSYMDIADALRRYAVTATLKEDLRELYARMLFNIFVGNDDDHLRNHALLREETGWRLSPLYDVLPRPTLAQERFQHLGVGPQGRLATLDNAFEARERFGLTVNNALSIIERVWHAVHAWRVHFSEAGVPATQISLIAPAFRMLEQIASSELRRRF